MSKRAVSDASFSVATSAEPVVTFLGRLEELKGIHLFLGALSKITSKARFYVAGFGTWSPRVEDAQRKHTNLQFLGAIKMAEVPYLLSNTDILVLPSITTDDGWGAVISEALMAGAAIVSSHKVGASMCLADPARGRVVNKLSEAEVARAVDDIIDNGLLNDSYRKARAEWADKHLTQRAGVEYLLRILDHLFHGKPRPHSFVSEHD
ncbi:glycosyltransferase [Bradyrhizobium sp. IC3123]|uniref:glycosyltransferase family 4 protein n=1 Tax=Bradyrhizobium sp. IC3123 TaxID=2793803 RepID=UPI001CD1E829|nr:glycosyltransferase [Bradyrhizobium sp. IC3123]MCA1392268.1 glycosyltransferase [Bradyrhizobium sp. IC3123]